VLAARDRYPDPAPDIARTAWGGGLAAGAPGRNLGARHLVTTVLRWGVLFALLTERYW